MSRLYTFAIAFLTAAVPTISFAQTLAVEIGAGTARIQPNPDVVCADGTEGFMITQKTVTADLNAAQGFGLPNTGRLPVRRGLKTESGNKHFRPAVTSLKSKRTVIDITKRRLRNEGSEDLYARARLSLEGCRSGANLRFVAGHLELTGQAALYRIDVDDTLHNLLGADGGSDTADTGNRPTLSGAPDNPLDGHSYSMREIAFEGSEEPMWFLSLKFSIDDWEFRAVNPGSPALSGKVDISWSSMMAEQTKPASGTN